MLPNFRFASRAHLRVCVQIANSRALSDAEAYSLPGWAHYPMLRLSSRLVRNRDIPRLNSRTAPIRIQRDKDPPGPAAGLSGRPPARAPAPLCVTGVIFAESREQCGSRPLSGPLRAVGGPLGGQLADGRGVRRRRTGASGRPSGPDGCASGESDAGGCRSCGPGGAAGRAVPGRRGWFSCRGTGTRAARPGGRG
jgi:hypothetical protein